MRQSGVIAAAALHALRNHRARIIEDHANARRFAEHVATIPAVRVELANVETNIVNVDLDAPLDAARVAASARGHGLLINATAPRRLRAVTHLDVTEADVVSAASMLAAAVASARS